jgi:hypothetical protein
MNIYGLEMVSVECELSVNMRNAIIINKPLRALRELRGERILTTKSTEGTKGWKV